MEFGDAAGLTRRLEALRATGLLDSPAERRFDRLTRVVAAALRVPVSLIALVDAERQFFKSAVGLGEPWDERRETPLSHSFCRHVVESEAPLVVDDSRTNSLVADNPAVDELGVAAYMGMPISDRDGVVIGSLCAIDHRPRHWDDADLDILADVAALVQREIAERQAADALARAERTWRGVLNAMPHMVWAAREDGTSEGFNKKWHEFTGTIADDPLEWSDFIHADERAAVLAGWVRALETGKAYEGEFRLRYHDGSYRWVLAGAVPLRGDDERIAHWFGSCTDIHAVKALQESHDLIKRELAGSLIERLSGQAAYAKGKEFEEIRGLIRALREVEA